MNYFMYRGKQIEENTSKWIYGFLCYCNDETATISDSTGSYKVDPKTIGICTVMKSKDFTKEIFTGDVIEVLGDYDSLDGFSKSFVDHYLCCWEDDIGAFVFKYIDSEHGIDPSDKYLIDEFSEQQYWVIGNIYDNPKLIKFS